MRRSLFAVGVALVAALALACSGSDDATPTPTATPDPVVAYEAAVTEIISRIDTERRELNEPIDEAMRTGSTATIIARVLEAVPQIIAVHEAGIAELEALDPPARYAADQARLVEGRRARVAILQRVIEAAETDDIVEMGALLEELGTNGRETLNALSPEFADLAFAGEQRELFATLNEQLNAEEGAYIEGLRAGAREFGTRAQAFGRAAQQTYPNPERLMLALSEAGAGEAMEAAYNVVSEIEPPDSLVADHALVLAYYEEAVRIDRLIGAAAREGDAAAFLILNDALRQSSGLAIFEVRPAVCVVLFPPPDCAAAVDVPEGEYERDLRFAMRDLLRGFGRGGPYGAFGLLPAGSDDVIVEASVVLAPQAIESIEDARALIAALDPPQELQADHAVLLAYLDEVLVQQAAIVVAAQAEDAAAIRAGIEATKAAICAASLALSEAAHPAVGFFFGTQPGQPPGITCPTS